MIVEGQIMKTKMRKQKLDTVTVGNKVFIYRAIAKRSDGVVGDLVGYRERNRRGELTLHAY